MTSPGLRPAPWALRWWPGHLVVLALLGLGIWLGAWQLETWSGKRQAEALDLTRSDPVALPSVLGPDEPFPAASVGQPVTVAGEWLSDATVYVERGTGYWVVTPLLTDARAGVALPVVRGVAEEPTAPEVSGAAELTGWLQPPEGTGAADDDPDDDVLPQLRVADLVQRVEGDLYGAYAVAAEPTPGLEAATLAQLPEVGRFTGLRNFFYALEWWVFGGFAVFVWVRYLMDEARRPERSVESSA
ncbi:SURF1 family protein [Nocardioides coralli]|uniref:SURF1 family protein n=1 Tax=Nocardioides coralli TaxID=2872154 RepID=UPI001CA3D01C|nr:SURF1 family protein [Nocardioides coralli]QZY29177.1 SURF1 family protein [Nocardioides coralli]